jgi:transcriptional regulator with XRE-family HTH domain
MPSYRARVPVIFTRAAALGIKPTGSAIGARAGIAPNTMNALLTPSSPRAPTLQTAARLVLALGVPFEELFELVDEETAETA